MTPQKENPVLAGTGLEARSSGWLNTSEHTLPHAKVQAIRCARLRHRFGLSQRRAALIADLAFDGGRGHD